MWVCVKCMMCTHAMTCAFDMWMPEDSFVVELILSFYLHMGSGIELKSSA